MTMDVDTVRPIPFLAAMLTMSVLAWGQALPVSYQTPPKCLTWLEGEGCTDHNWTLGPQWNCWAFAWAGVHGGVLDLASWRLPDGGAYTARFPFELPEAGEHVVYWLGRVAGYQASAIEWQIDDGPAQRFPPQGERDWYNRLADVANLKYEVSRLGAFTAEAGQHTLTITVREPCEDGGLQSAPAVHASSVHTLVERPRDASHSAYH
jgi:hypothetical protein